MKNSLYSVTTMSRKSRVLATLWMAGSDQLISLKMPSILLLNPDMSFKSFGYEAENDYGDLAAGYNYKDYYYFRRFGMLLYNAEGLKRDMIVEDDKGKKLRVIVVFSLAIQYLKDHCIQTLRTRETQIQERDILWILTVPAIWNDGSKQFMKEAAHKAGIEKESLLITLKPEAAVIFCMHLPVDKMSVEGSSDGTSTKVSPFQKGTKYMVVDVGERNVDITINQLMDKGQLQEIDYASSEAWGGSMVDEAFKQFLYKLIGKDVYETFEEDCKEDQVQLYKEFETKKRNFVLGKRGMVIIKIPVALFDTFKNVRGERFKDHVEKIVEFQNKVYIIGDKLRVDADIMRSWFDHFSWKIVELVRQLLRHKTATDVNTILLVGGFSETPMLQDAMRSNFRDKRLIIPDDPGFVVLKGAVIYGHNPTKYFYGESPQYITDPGCVNVGLLEGEVPDLSGFEFISLLFV